MSLEIHSDPPVTPQDDINNNATAASESPQRPSQKTAKINLTTRAKIVLSTLGGSSVICGVFAALGALSVIALPTTAIAVLIGAAAALAATTIAYAIISLRQNHTPKKQGTKEYTHPKEIQNNSQQPQIENELNGATDIKNETSLATNNLPENQVQNDGEISKEQNEQATTNNTPNEQNKETIQSETDTSGTLNEQNKAQSIISDEASGEFNPSNSVDEVKNESPESNDNKPNSTSPDNVNSADEQSLAENPEAPQNNASDIPVSPKKSDTKPKTKITIIGSRKAPLQFKGQNLPGASSTAPEKIKKALPIGAVSKQDSTNIGIVDSLCELGKQYTNSTMIFVSNTNAPKKPNKKSTRLVPKTGKVGSSDPIAVLQSRLSSIYNKHRNIFTIRNDFQNKNLNQLYDDQKEMHQELEQVLKQRIKEENILSNLDAMERQRSKFTNDQATSDNPQANATLTEQYKKLKELGALLTFYTSKGSKNYQELQKKLNDIQNSILPTGNKLLNEVENLSKAFKQSLANEANPKPVNPW